MTDFGGQAGGAFVISLDFELYWGWRDRTALSKIQRQLDTARSVVPRLLQLFEEFELHVTWATVGLLMYENAEDAAVDLPEVLPQYADANLSPYEQSHLTGRTEDASYYYARSLVEQIARVRHQEIGTHTFSHMYCLEPGNDAEAFRADLNAAVRAAATLSQPTHSIVFPRNQVNEECLDICRQLGLVAFRGNENAWPYRAIPASQLYRSRRAMRLLDSYINLTGNHLFDVGTPPDASLVNVPASRFFRAYKKRLRLLEPMKLRRIKRAMTAAARQNKGFHLWWHPEDFGNDPGINLRQLRTVAEHFQSLKKAYNMQSLTMREAALAEPRREPSET